MSQSSKCDDKPSIAELQKRIAAMTPHPWVVDGGRERYAVWTVHDDNDDQVADCYDNTPYPEQQCEENAHGIVLLRNAAPVLLEIAAALLAERATSCTCGARVGADSLRHLGICALRKAAEITAAAIAKVRS